MTSLLAFLLVVFLYGSIESIKARKSYESGQFMMGVLLPLTKGKDCATINHKSVQLVETIIYGVKKLNINLNFPSNFTIGYEIRDTCSNPKVAVMEASTFVSGILNHSTCVGKIECEHQNEVISILGPQILENIVLSAGFLSLHQYPQVSQ